MFHFCENFRSFYLPSNKLIEFFVMRRKSQVRLIKYCHVYIVLILAYPLQKKGNIYIYKKQEEGGSRVEEWKSPPQVVIRFFGDPLLPLGMCLTKDLAAAGGNSHNSSSPVQRWVIPCDLPHEVGMVPSIMILSWTGNFVTQPLPCWSGSSHYIHDGCKSRSVFRDSHQNDS
jgi:hypothetical protein